VSTTDPHWLIVGGGAAGCVLANRLSADPDASVLLLEAGPSDAGVADIDDASRWTSLFGGAYDWGFAYAPTPAVLDRTIPIPRGRVLGGSSSTNAMLWYRGAPVDYDRWADHGATGWDWASMLPYFKRSEDWEGGATDLRGAGGPMKVRTSPDLHPVAVAMLEGAPEIGVPRIDDPNGPTNEGAGSANLNAVVGDAGRMRRWSTVRGYLDPVRGRPNLTIATGTTATRIVLEHGRAVGVEHVVDGVTRMTRATRGVVLALGAIGTPLLLQASGIGDPDHLRPLGVEVAHALPGVGDGFQDHPLVSGMNASATAPLGPLRDNGGGSMMSWRSSLAAGEPDLHAFVVQESRPAAAVDQDLSGEVFAVSPGLMRSISSGYVRLRSADGSVPPEIQPNLLRERSDVDRLVEGVERILDLMATPAFRALGAKPLVRFRDRREVERFVRAGADTFFHACGSARMGADAAAPVTPELAVRGLDGLFVADASVIPVIPTSNTQWPVIAIAERAADLLTGKDAA
jgi:choline dehydrogenase